MTDTTMLEKAARALAAEDARDRGVDLFDKNPGLYLRLARAVLMAVRKPDEAVFNRANDALFDAGDPVAHETVHAAMIDAILADGEGG